LQEDADRAAQQSKPGEVRRAAHTLKSNAANFGATAMAVACLELEEAGRNNTLEGAASLLVKIKLEFEQARTALLATREQLRTGGGS
jgi:two-component system sensor histidine kinase/response regulator